MLKKSEIDHHKHLTALLQQVRRGHGRELRGSVIVQKPFDKLSCSSSKNSTQRQLSEGLGISDQQREGTHGESEEQSTQLNGFRRATLSLLCAANCLNNCFSGRRLIPCMCSQSHRQSHKPKSLWECMYEAVVAVSNSQKVLVHQS